MAFSLFTFGAAARPPPALLCSRRPLMSLTCPSPESTPLPPARIVCVGDIHSQWNEHDESALRALNPDLALFVGDYGDEDVSTVRRLADFARAAPFPIATVFGNHDAFFTASHNGRRRAPYIKGAACRVTEQLDLLRPWDVSYRSVPIDAVHLSVVGGRAFSSGGPHWKYKQFYQRFMGLGGMSQSSARLRTAVRDARYDALLFLAHSGPTGLGERPSDPCGKDWGEAPGGDYGDKDLRVAIEEARKEGRRVPMVVFGHMHKTLSKRKGERTMVVTERDGERGGTTVMVNAAVVPRHKVGAHSSAQLHHFQVVHMGELGVRSVEETWVTRQGEVAETLTVFDAEAVSASSTADLAA